MQQHKIEVVVTEVSTGWFVDATCDGYTCHSASSSSSDAVGVAVNGAIAGECEETHQWIEVPVDAIPGRRLGFDERAVWCLDTPHPTFAGNDRDAVVWAWENERPSGSM